MNPNSCPFYCPVQIIFAYEALSQAAEQLKSLGSKALIVSGKQSAKLSGALDDLCKTLDQLGINWVHYDGISENPDLDSIITGKQILLDNRCDFVIGVGGGSPIDAAKAISLAAANGLSRNQLYATDRFNTAYPIVAIPTTSGTGSEATQYSVLTDTAVKRKGGFGHKLAFPKLAVLDPRYTLSLPEKVTLNTALDALSHLLEGLYSRQRNSLVFPLIHSGVAAIMKYLPMVLNEPDNLLAREELMRASLYGGMVIAQGSTTLQHAIGYPLTSYYDVPHGLANAIAMPAVMELYYPAIASELESLFRYLNCNKDSFLAWLKALPFPQSLELSDSFIQQAIPLVMSARNMALNPIEVSEYQVRLIYETIRTGT